MHATWNISWISRFLLYVNYFKNEVKCNLNKNQVASDTNFDCANININWKTDVSEKTAHASKQNELMMNAEKNRSTFSMEAQMLLQNDKKGRKLKTKNIADT